MSFLCSEYGGTLRRQMGLRMKERSIGVADDRMIERVLLLYRLMFGYLV